MAMLLFLPVGVFAVQLVPQSTAASAALLQYERE
jgi:hypothetical protein